MATTYTPLLGLAKHATTDPFDVTLLNDNANTMDTAMGKAYRGKAAHNLLDNSDLTNAVNQRGITSISTKGAYIADRWVVNNVASGASVAVNQSGITCNNASGGNTLSVCQYLTIPRAGTYTVCAKTGATVIWRTITFADNGTLTDGENHGFSDGQIYVSGSMEKLAINLQTFAEKTVTYTWAALYEGAYTADTLPEYVPKGYAAELAECQRYYRYYYVGNGYLTGHAFAANRIRFMLPGEAMRITPTVTADRTVIFKGASAGQVQAQNITVAKQCTDGLLMEATTATESLTAWELVETYAGNSYNRIILSADL